MSTDTTRRKPIKHITISQEVVDYIENTRAMPGTPIKSFSGRLDEVATIGMRYEIKRAELERTKKSQQ